MDLVKPTAPPKFTDIVPLWTSYPDELVSVPVPARVPLVSVTEPTVSLKPAILKLPPLTNRLLESEMRSAAAKVRVPTVTVVAPV